jgi:hypothetical protein
MLKTVSATLTVVECDRNGWSEPKTLKLDTTVATILKITMGILNGYFSCKWRYENISRAKGEVNKMALAL